MDRKIFLMMAFCLRISDSQTLTSTTPIIEGNPVTLTCETANFSQNIFFAKNGINRGGCFAGVMGICSTGVSGYNTPVRVGATKTSMTITSYTDSTDKGDWTCSFGGSLSFIVKIEISTSSESDDCKIDLVVCILVISGIVLFVVSLTTALLYLNKDKLQQKVLEKIHRCDVRFIMRIVIAAIIITAALITWLIVTGLIVAFMCTCEGDKIWSITLGVTVAIAGICVVVLFVLVKFAVHDCKAITGQPVTISGLERDHDIRNVTWRHKGNLIIPEDSVIYSGGQINNPPLTVLNASVNDGGPYRCILKLADNKTTLYHFMLEVEDLQQMVDAGKKITLLSNINNMTNIMYVRWYSAKGVLIEEDCRFQVGNIYNPAMTIKFVSIEDRGRYKCVLGINENGKEVEKRFMVNLEVNVPVYEKAVGEEVVFLDDFERSLQVKSVRWLFGDHDVSRTNTVSKYQGGTPAIPALRVESLTENDSGQYQCIIEFQDIYLSFNVTVKLNVIAKSSNLPPIRGQVPVVNRIHPEQNDRIV